jgi:hypothetical protein
MTPTEAIKVFRQFSSEIGPRAWVSVGLTNDYGIADGALSCSVYPQGVTNAHAFTVFADDLAGLATVARAKWAEHSAEFRQQQTRKMALAIIRITAAHGHCTDAALRQEFSTAEVTEYSAAACADANTIAGKGPFEVVTLGGSNYAPPPDEIAGMVPQ